MICLIFQELGKVVYSYRKEADLIEFVSKCTKSKVKRGKIHKSSLLVSKHRSIEGYRSIFRICRSSELSHKTVWEYDYSASNFKYIDLGTGTFDT